MGSSMRSVLIAGAFTLGAAALAAVPAQAEQLVIARAISANAMDPGFLREAATLVDNVFDTLVMRNSEMQLGTGPRHFLEDDRRSDLGIHPAPWCRLPGRGAV